MIPYILIFLIFAFLAISRWQNLKGYKLIFAFSLLALFIGYRDEVGGDWERYVDAVDIFQGGTIAEVLPRRDGLFFFLNWLSGKVNGHIYLVNLICGSIFTGGLIAYCKNTKYPWLGIIIAFPVLILIVALGYTRQSVAIGLEFFVLLALENKKFIKSIALTTTALGFHLTAFTLYALIIKEWKRYALKVKYFLKYIAIILILLFTLYQVWERSADIYLAVYILNGGGIQAGDYASQGTLPRLLPTLLSSFTLIFNQKRFIRLDGAYKTSIYLTLSYVSIFLTLLFFIYPLNTTWIDRMALYCAPLTIYVFTRVVDFRFLKLSPSISTTLIVSGCFSYILMWLNLALHAKYWIPYKNILFFF